jgi:acetate kinase
MNQGNDRAKLALDIFVHRLQASIGAMVAALGGLDALIFGAEVRQAACANFVFFLAGSSIAQKMLHLNRTRIFLPQTSAVCILVVRAQEGWSIACEAWQLVSTSQNPVLKKVCLIDTECTKLHIPASCGTIRLK